MRKRRFRSEKNRIVIKKKFNKDVMFKESVSVGQISLKPIFKKLPIITDYRLIGTSLQLSFTKASVDKQKIQVNDMPYKPHYHTKKV